MRAAFLAVSLVPLIGFSLGAQGNDPANRQRSTAERLIKEATKDSAAWNKIAELTDRFGHRLSGSKALEDAIDWVLDKMKTEGLENVHGEDVMVPVWVRGRESLSLIEPRKTAIPMLGLGGSVGTKRGGIEADVLVVSSFDDLKKRGAEVNGKIVIFDVPFIAYPETVKYRAFGMVEAAKLGAIAAGVRSIGPYGLRTPHTGGLRYDSTVKKIPAFAIPMEDAAMLHRMQDRGQKVRLRVEMNAVTKPDQKSRNIIAEIRGREKPEEIVVIGGHIDSWDVGSGAVDDGGGVVVAWEALRLIKALGLTPRRTIRVVGWTNEENGLRGALAYRDQHRDELDRHLVALESDGGVFRPIGFGFSGSDSARGVIKAIASLLVDIGADSVTSRGDGADIEPLGERGVPTLAHNTDMTKYFWYHHTEADNVDKLDPKEVAQNVAAIAVMAWVIAEEGLPRGH